MSLWGDEADGQERSLKMSLVQNGGVMKTRRAGPPQELLSCLGLCEGWLITSLGAGGKKKRRFSREFSYAIEDLLDTAGLAIVKLR